LIVSERTGIRALLPRVTLVLAGLLAPAAGAQVAAPLPPEATIDGDPREWSGLPPSFRLRAHSAGARSGTIWLGQTDEGLVVAGMVDGPPPRFLPGPAEMAGGDHLELRLALIDQVPLPRIGWGNQFGPVELDTAEDCAKIELAAEVDDPANDCRDWFRAQGVYREAFKRLFARQWRLAPAMAVETLAGPAFESAGVFRDWIRPLEPRGRPRALFAVNAGGGYGFEIVVPWEAMPPSSRLELDRVWIGLTVFSPGSGGHQGAYSSTGSLHRNGEAPSMNPARMDPVRRWQVGACTYRLEADDTWLERKLPGYFIPTAGPAVTEIFVIENATIGYQYLPEAVSPVVRSTRFFVSELKPGVSVCGPPLAVRRGDVVVWGEQFAVHPGIRAAPVPGGWLIADGPWTGIATRFGTGACGACPLISLQMLFVPENEGAAKLAFAESWLVEDEELEPDADPEEPAYYGHNARVAVSEDLRSISVWEGKPSDDRSKIAWVRSRLCYDDRRQAFATCGRPTSERPAPQMPMPPDEPS
jgi:hypothetical protein